MLRCNSRKKLRHLESEGLLKTLPLVVSLSEVYREVHQTDHLLEPKPLHLRSNINRSLYCEYHENYKHKAEDCYDLWDTIE